jgi:malonate-semialdehyde dehydrogenase (acetylating)/methylmalonate-semialdehyde dehydrogenase
LSLPVLQNYINGAFVSSSASTHLDVHCPATGEAIARVPLSTKEEVDQAVHYAQEAFAEWRATPPLTRARYLFRLRDRFEENFEELARILVREEGKTIDESRGEIRRMIETVEHATGVTTLMTGYCLEDVAKDVDTYAERQPLGVFACIPPFNFPAMVPWWFLPYALVTGNTYLVKPSELVPMTQTRVFEIIDEVGFPEGVVNMVHGSREAVNAILHNPQVKGVSFVGQTSTAQYIYQVCGRTGKRVQALGGAKNCLVVMPDANLEKGLPSIMTSFFGCAGERCLSGSLLVAVGDVYERLKDKFLAAARAMRVGNGLTEGVAMGPVVSQAHKEKILGFIEKGLAEGADLLLDGRNITIPGHEGGYFVGPTVFDNVTPEMTIAREEIFGPVVGIIRVADLDEAIRLINNSPYANAACLYTAGGRAAREFKYRVAPSMIGINIGIAAPMAFFPFGGAKNSLYGDLKGHGREIFQFFTDTKVVITRWF